MTEDRTGGDRRRGPRKAAPRGTARGKTQEPTTERPETAAPEGAGETAAKTAGKTAATSRAKAPATAAARSTAPAAPPAAQEPPAKRGRPGARRIAQASRSADAKTTGKRPTKAAAKAAAKASAIPGGTVTAAGAADALADTSDQPVDPLPEKAPKGPRHPGQPQVRRINVALQGGGAHGAFTWGVLDRILEDPTIEIAGISGCSAGALNGAALKAGLVQGGRAGARDNLDWLWGQMGAIPDLSFMHWLMNFVPGPAMTARLVETVVPFSLMDAVTSAISPYDLPFWENPLERVVKKFRFDHVCTMEGPAFFVSATNVRSGKVRVFSDGQITTDAILASACLPTLFRAVEIADPDTGALEAYWDGGYSGNPALFPLFDPALPDDIVIVNINPMWRDDIPDSSVEIGNRVNEISFNAALLRELRAIAFVKRLIANGQVKRGAMKDVLVHLIGDDALMNQLGVATKLVPTPTLLAQLKAAGRAAAERFLDDHGARLGRESSVDIAAML